MAIKLHRCKNLWVKGPHPCWNVQKAQRIQIEGLTTPGEAKATPSPGGGAPGEAKPTPLPPRGQQTLDQGLSKDQEFKIVASNLFGPVETAVKVSVATFTAVPTATPTATPLPTVTAAPTEIPLPVVEAFDVVPDTINLGQQVRITWRVSNADSVAISGLVDGQAAGLPLEGALTDQPDRTARYRITTSNKGRVGPVVERVVTVRPTPTAVPPTPTRPPSTG